MERPGWKKFLYAIWPKIYRFINEVAFFILMLLRTATKLAIRQIKPKV